jgi:electron transfer flavoprotein alpha subunit
MTGVLVVLEQRRRDGRPAWSRMSWEALAAGRRLSEGLGQPLFAAVAGSGLEEIAGEMTASGAAKVYRIEHELLRDYTADGFTAALEQFVRRLDPACVLFPHTYQARDFLASLAARFGEAPVADAVALRVEGGAPVFVRQLMQGRLSADYRHTGDGPCFVSVQAGAFRADPPAETAAEIEVFTPQLDASRIRQKPGEPFRESAQTVDLAAAPLIVSVGRGIKERDNLPIVEELARALGAEMAASRPICDNGWLPMERQVGSSGQTVSPKVYIAIGISGAIQHLVGMKGSKSVIAINKDENAPIFEVADYGVVGDLFEVAPALTAAVKKAKGG